MINVRKFIGVFCLMLLSVVCLATPGDKSNGGFNVDMGEIHYGFGTLLTSVEAIAAYAQQEQHTNTYKALPVPEVSCLSDEDLTYRAKTAYVIQDNIGAISVDVAALSAVLPYEVGWQSS